MPKDSAVPEVLAMDRDRRGHGISAKVMCARAGVAPSTWCDWKRGVKPREASLQRMRAALASLIADSKRGRLP